jgi:hypothetical protein
MIEFEKFFIPHIGKTGGDAIKSICKNLNLKIIDIKEDLKKGKHVPPRHLFDKKDMVLSIRRLPSREISKINQLVYVDKTLTWKDIGNPSTYILDKCQAEIEIKRNTNDGQIEVKKFIRSEYLLEDLEQVLSFYFQLNENQKKLIKKIPTKKPLSYERDWFYWFEPEEILELYEKSPVWRKYEKLAYPKYRYRNRIY